jgi:hypothetical protein
MRTAAEQRATTAEARAAALQGRGARAVALLERLTLDFRREDERAGTGHSTAADLTEPC